jgi:hypothetical protein
MDVAIGMQHGTHKPLKNKIKVELIMTIPLLHQLLPIRF